MLQFTSETSAFTCQGCHYDQYEEWRLPFDQRMVEVVVAPSPRQGTFHALAWIDQGFQEAYQDNGQSGFCQRCHIPDSIFDTQDRSGIYAPLSRGLMAGNAQEGVTCVSCHLDSEGVIRGPTGPTVPGVSPHPLRQDNIYHTVEVCASCHDDEVYGAFTRTVEQWYTQTDGSRICQDCHMSPGRVTHLWTGGHDPLRLADTFHFEIKSSGDSPGSTLSLTVVNEGAAHSAPTGDVYRAFWLHLYAMSPSGELVWRSEWQISQPVVLEGILRELDNSAPRILPIPSQGSAELPLQALEPGEYTLKLVVDYYTIKPCELISELTSEVEVVEPSSPISVQTSFWQISISQGAVPRVISSGSEPW